MVHCFLNIWFNKRTHPNEHRNGYRLSTKWVLASNQSSVRSWLVQPIKESAEGLCAGRDCALIRQLAIVDEMFDSIVALRTQSSECDVKYVPILTSVPEFQRNSHGKI